ncbi:kinase-like domain-containing protein [Gigaspora rosea]|uniref:Kinase-like domain-containing protein n=1 Tax=Gigaspora rosea TaxID=44941 RepID=A0A397VZQ7_9GLOM|nr:kinase-like domain-containing protein [Gigaspora rosea]
MDALTKEIRGLSLTNNERGSLRGYFVTNPEKVKDILYHLHDCETDDEKQAFLKSLISTPGMLHYCPRRVIFANNTEYLFLCFLSCFLSSNPPKKYIRVIVEQPVAGSTTRARAYRNIYFRPVDLEYFLSKTRSRLNQLGKIDKYESIENYINGNSAPTTSEEDVQTWFDKLIRVLPTFSSNLSVVDTHTNKYLEGYKPDFSILVNEDAKNQVYIPMFVCTLLKVKKRKSSSSGLDDESKGQLLDYIQVLIRQQPLRIHFAIFLSDGYNFYVMDYNRDTKRYSEFSTNFLTGIRLFWVLINDMSPFTSLVGPRRIDFRMGFNVIGIRLKGYLGKGASSTVYEIEFENTPSAIKILKSGYTTVNEVRALRFLNGHNFPNVPIRVAHNSNSIIIRPVCKQIGKQIDNKFQVSHAQQLLHLLKRIHILGIYHRDVRPENILLNTKDNELILADWGSAIQYKNTGAVEYEGTVLFSSPNILNNNFGYYIPKASDDLHSFIRTIYILQNPSIMPTIPDGDLSLRAKAIREYWNDNVDVKLGGPFWKEMIDAATNENYDVLEKCCYVFKK